MATREVLGIAHDLVNAVGKDLNQKPQHALEILSRLSRIDTSDRALVGLSEQFDRFMRVAEFLPQCAGPTLHRFQTMCDDFEDQLTWDEYSQVEVLRWRDLWTRVLNQKGLRDFAVPPIPTLTLAQRRQIRKNNFSLVYLPAIGMEHMRVREERMWKIRHRIGFRLEDAHRHDETIQEVPFDTGKWFAVITNRCNGGDRMLLQKTNQQSFLVSKAGIPVLEAACAEAMEVSSRSVRSPSIAEFRLLSFAAHGLGEYLRYLDPYEAWCRDPASSPDCGVVVKREFEHVLATVTTNEDTHFFSPFIDLQAI